MEETSFLTYDRTTRLKCGVKRLFWHDRHGNLKMFLVLYNSPDNWHGNGVWYGCLDPGWRRDGVPAAVGSGAVVPGSEAQQLLQQLAAESGSFWTTRWPPSTAPAAPRAAATPASFWRNYRGRGRAWSWVWTPWTPPCPPLAAVIRNNLANTTTLARPGEEAGLLAGNDWKAAWIQPSTNELLGLF